MAMRSGREGGWVLPVAAVFLSLAVLDAIVWLLRELLKPIQHGGLAATLDTAVAVLTAAAAVCLAATIAGIAWLLAGLFQLSRQGSEPGAVELLLRRQIQLLESLNEAALVSERARAVAFREKEREALRRAIREDVAKQDWEAAYHLIDEMQRRFGYHQEAQRLREEVDQRRSELLRAALASESAKFRQLLARCDWCGARTEAEALLRRHPGNAALGNLFEQIDEARQGHKRKLLADLNLARERSDIDRSIAILKELDQYLTPGEAEGLEEAARDVFRKKLHNMGVQFSILVSEKNWTEAIKVGQDIIHEYPNSRMAQEVRDNLDGLRKRAGMAEAPA